MSRPHRIRQPISYPAQWVAEQEARVLAHAARVARECPYDERLELFDVRIRIVAGVQVRVYPGRGKWWWRLPGTRQQTGHQGPFASKVEALADCERTLRPQGE